MKAAISSDGKYVSPHFGRCPQFTILEIKDNKLVSKKVIKNPGHGTGFLPQFLEENGVSYVAASGMGARAEELFKEADIKTVLGVEGKVDDVINKIVEGTLKGSKSSCKPGEGKGYGIEKNDCEHD